MKYMGSKNRHAKELISSMCDEVGGSFLGASYENWVEPFVGGANMIDKVPKLLFTNIIGNDLNQYLIRMFQFAQKGWTPPDTMSEIGYQNLKRNSECFIDDENAPLTGFVGIGCSYAGKWFGGYARGNDNKGNPRNYCLESKNNLRLQMRDLGHVQFFAGDYQAVPIPDKSIIYCDPPYQQTTKYKGFGFDHKRFWEWCDEQVAKGHKVFVSEYNAPEGWRCIWQKEVNNSLTKETGSKQGIEKLFTK